MEGKFEILILNLFNFILLILFFNYFLFFILENFNFNNFFIYLMSTLPISTNRYSKGRFISVPKPYTPLPTKLFEAIIGDLLGDGHLRFNKKGLEGKPTPNSNANFAVPLKSLEHITYYYIFMKIYL
jgi:hypothetical protein